jgi:hypothetical protein
MIPAGENGSNLEKTYPRPILSTINLIQIDLGSNPGLCGGRSPTNRMSNGMDLKT